MYQCVSDRFDICRRVYPSLEEFFIYCDSVLGTRPVLSPDTPDADAYYDTSGFILVKLKEGEIVQTMG